MSPIAKHRARSLPGVARFAAVACCCVACAALGATRARAQDEVPDGGAPDAGAPEAPGPGAPTPDGGAPAGSPPPVAAATTPPRLIESPDPHYPETHVTIGIEPIVHLHVTVEADGTVSDAHVEHPGDHIFDAAAIEAVRGWRFEPARRGDEP